MQVMLGGGLALLACVTISAAGLLGGSADGPGPASRRLLSSSDDNSTCDDDLITPLSDFDRNGGLVVHCLGILYIFLGIAIICDDYFVESLERISEALNLSDDVAGATFMAAGSSAPELAVAVVATLFAAEPSDEGLGTIVGSAVFNIMIIVGVTAICAGQTLDITPYPFARDCAFYTLSIAMLVAFVYDGKVEVWESVILLFGYVLYIGYMTQNQKIADKIVRWKIRRKRRIAPATTEEERQRERNTRMSIMPDFKLALAKNTSINPAYKAAYHMAHEPGIEHERLLERKRIASVAESALAILTVNRISKGWLEKAKTQSKLPTVPSGDGSSSSETMTNAEAAAKAAESAPPVAAAEEEEEAMGPVGKALWVLGMPYKVLFLSVPDCRKDKWHKWYLGTFLMSIFWIGALSYVMLFFSQRAGCILDIPPIVMGVVIISAGTSVPDALSSVFVARNGQGDMAVSNVLGSNVFNIFLGLGLPWFFYTTIRGKPLESPGLSQDLVPSILILFGYLFLLVAVMHFSGWKLYPKVGYILCSLHIFFVAYSLLTNEIGGTTVIDVSMRRRRS